MATGVVVDADILVRNWWAIVLRGVFGIFFGIVTLVAPDISLAALVLLFGAYAFADGVLAIIAAIRRRQPGEPRWIFLVEGLVGVAAGIGTLVWPAVTALALLYVVAAWSLVTGILEIVAAIGLRRVIRGEWLLALSGVLSIALGVVLALFPRPGALALVIWIGAYAFVFGVFLVALGLRLRSWGKSHGLPMAHGMGPGSVPRAEEARY